MTPEEAFTKAVADGGLMLEFDDPSDALLFRNRCTKLRIRVRKAAKENNQFEGRSPWDHISLKLSGEFLNFHVIKSPVIVEKQP